MSNEEKLIIKLLNEFSFYNKSVVYYQNIIKNIDFVNVNDLLNKLRKKIVNNMTNDWSMGNIDWFCSAIMRADDLLEAFSKLFKRLEKYELGPDEKFVKTIIIKYPNLKERILQEFGFSDPITLNLQVITLSFALMFKINISSIIGMILSIFIYKKI